MTTIADLLIIPRFSNISLLNDKADLSRIVDTIELTETPDVSAYIPKNTLLLTTAMAFKNNPNLLCNMIEELNELPAAGLGIKLGRFIDDLDEKIIETANRLRFPILKIPMTTTLGAVSHQLLSYLWDTRVEKMHYALDIQRSFSKLLINGATLQSLTRHLGIVLKRPVLLLSPFMETIATSQHLKKDSIFEEKTVSLIKEKLKKVADLNTEISFVLKHSEEGNFLVSVFPIKFTAYYPYLLVVLKVDQIPYPFSQLAIEQASTILSFTIYKNLKLEESNHRLREEFFHTLTWRNSQDAEYISNWLDYGKPFGLIPSNSYRILVAGIDQTIKTKNLVKFQEDIYALVYEWLEKKLNEKFVDALLFHIHTDDKFAILLQNREENLKDTLASISSEFSTIFPVSLSFAAGNEVFKTEAIHYSFAEAMETFTQSQKNMYESFIQFYESKGIMELIQYIPTEHAKYFCLHTLKSLAYPTNETQQELRRTLQVYLNCQCEITETAKQLFVHKNTVKYRIAKCNQLFDYEISDPDFSLRLRLSLLLSQNEVYEKN